jgi:hypothetical protein
VGAKYPVSVFTDHENLLHWKLAQRIGQCIACYITTMGDYNVILEHRPGATNHADPLSRRLDFDNGSHDNESVITLPDHLFAATADTLDLEEAVIAAQKRHVPTIQA